MRWATFCRLGALVSLAMAITSFCLDVPQVGCGWLGLCGLCFASTSK